MKTAKKTIITVLSMLSIGGVALGVGTLSNHKTLNAGTNALNSSCALTFSVKDSTIVENDYIQTGSVRLMAKNLTKSGKNLSLSTGGEIATTGAAFDTSVGYGSVLNEINSINVNLVSGSFDLYTSYTGVSAKDYVKVMKNVSTVGLNSFVTDSVYMRKPRYFKLVALSENTVIKSLAVDCEGQVRTELGQLKDGEYNCNLKYYTTVDNVLAEKTKYRFSVVNGVISLPSMSYDTQTLDESTKLNYFPAIRGTTTDEYLCAYLASLNDVYEKSTFEYFHYFSGRVEAYVYDENYYDYYFIDLLGITEYIPATSIQVLNADNSVSADNVSIAQGTSLSLKAKAKGDVYNEVSDPIVWSLENTTHVKFKGTTKSKVETKNLELVTLETVSATTTSVKLTVSCGLISKVINVSVEAASSSVDASLVGTFRFDSTYEDGYVDITIKADGSGLANDYQWEALCGEDSWTASEAVITNGGLCLSVDTGNVVIQVENVTGTITFTGATYVLTGSQFAEDSFTDQPGAKQ